MNWNDYEAVWKRQELPRGADADAAALRAAFETQHRKQAATLLVRDFSEAGAGVVVAMVLGAFWLKLGRASWPLGLAILLALGVSAVFIRERLRIRKTRLGEDASLLAKVASDLVELRRQRRLLGAIWLWYLGPILAAILIVHFTVVARAPAWSIQRDPVFNAGFIVFHALVVGFAWWLNWRAGRRQLEPRIAELEKLQRDLGGTNNS